jgi:EAL domain-containing protein (putative c-di-GMP-specific phosphodiesterase class I)
LVKIDNCLGNLKNLYIQSSDCDKNKIIRVLEKISDNVNVIDDLVLNVESIDAHTKLPNRESLLCDIDSLEGEAMLMFLHNNQIGALKELYGIEVAKKIILDKATKLDKATSGLDATLYSINLQKFAILVKKKSQFDKYLSILQYAILNNIEDDSYKLDDHTTIISDFTVGIAQEKEYLFHRANVALQEARLSKQKYKMFKSDEYSRSLNKTALQRLDVYKNALHSGNIIPYFQPIFNAKDNTVMKYEALARIVADDGEIISPYYFLNSAIEDNTFEFFTRQMLQKVFNIYSKVDAEISFNLTYGNINSSSMLEYIKNRLDKYGGDRITFEIVETEEIQDYAVLEAFIVMVKEYDAKVSIDDFGSGYSNFTNIIRLNIDFIKIDGTLIRELLNDGKAHHMVEALIIYSKNINVKTIAEFVSSKELSDEVKRMGIDYIQGYYHGEPQSAEYYGLT